jgi:hypothetical protein
MMQKSQIETDDIVLNFLGDRKIKEPKDLVELRAYIQNYLEFREYDEQGKEHEKSIRWKRTASDIIKDGYVYKGKSCSDLSIIFLALCKAAGAEGYLVKLISLDKKNTHSIVEVKLDDKWYRLDITVKDSVPFEGQLPPDQIWNKNWLGGWKLWKRGRDLWDLGLNDINSDINEE